MLFRSFADLVGPAEDGTAATADPLEEPPPDLDVDAIVPVRGRAIRGAEWAVPGQGGEVGRVGGGGW